MKNSKLTPPESEDEDDLNLLRAGEASKLRSNCYGFRSQTSDHTFDWTCPEDPTDLPEPCEQVQCEANLVEEEKKEPEHPNNEATAQKDRDYFMLFQGIPKLEANWSYWDAENRVLKHHHSCPCSSSDKRLGIKCDCEYLGYPGIIGGD